MIHVHVLNIFRLWNMRGSFIQTRLRFLASWWFINIWLFRWLISRGKFKAVPVDSIVEQTVIPLAFEIWLSRYDPDASPYQGANQCNAPIMLAVYKILDFQSQAKVQANFWGHNLWGEISSTPIEMFSYVGWYRQSSTAKPYIAASLTHICKSNYDYDII